MGTEQDRLLQQQLQQPAWWRTGTHDRTRARAHTRAHMHTHTHNHTHNHTHTHSHTHTHTHTRIHADNWMQTSNESGFVYRDPFLGQASQNQYMHLSNMGTLGVIGANTRDVGHSANTMGMTTVGGGGMSDWMLGGGGLGRREGIGQIADGMAIGGGSGPVMGQAAIGITPRRLGDGGEHAAMSHAQQPVRPFAGGGEHVGAPLMHGERRVHEGVLKGGGVMNHGSGQSCEAGETRGNGFGFAMQRAGHRQDLMAMPPVNMGLSNASGGQDGGLWFPGPAHPVAGAGVSYVPFGHWPSLLPHQAMAQPCRLFSQSCSVPFQ